MRSVLKAGNLLLALAIWMPAQRMASTYANLQSFLDTCPQNDPYTPIIRRDFQILRDQVAVGDIPCTEPYTQMPAAQVTDELSILQALRFMYYMDMGRSGYLPWTSLRMYDWVKSRISGVNISSALAGGDCCFTLNGLKYISVGSFAGGASADGTSVAIAAQYHQSPDGVAAEVGFFAHEARHTEGTGYRHVSGCPAFPTGGTLGCDQTYDEADISAYGTQYYLAKQMLTGGINLGYSCGPQTRTLSSYATLGAAFQGLANVFPSRFVTNAPPQLSLPASPGGPCIPASTFSVTTSSAVATAVTLKVSASNAQAGWTADSAVNWITASVGANSVGSSQAVFTVNPNPGNSAKSGMVVVAGVTVPVVCAPDCTTPPAISPSGIVPAFSTVPTIQSGEWASIYGNFLAGSTVVWNGDFPISLGGTSVTINGKAAYLSFVSPTQINLQVPNDTAVGSVPVVVTTATGTSASTVALAQSAPSFLLLDATHIAGIILRSDGSGAYGGGSYDIIGPTGNSLGYPTVAVKAGDSISLFAVGLGPTSPAVPPGQAFSGAAPTLSPVSILINNVSVTPTFAGLSSAGLYQINLTVPANLGMGDVSLAATVAGRQTQSGVVISLPGCPSGARSCGCSTLGPGDTLEATFTSVPVPAADVLAMGSIDLITSTGAPVTTAELFNGANLLGTTGAIMSSQGNYYLSVLFKSPTSLYPGGAVADLTSMQNGTIQGSIKVTVSGGAISGLCLPDLNLVDGVGVSNGYGGTSIGNSLRNINITLNAAPSAANANNGLRVLSAASSVPGHLPEKHEP